MKATQRRHFGPYRRWVSSRGAFLCTPSTHHCVFTTSLFNSGDHMKSPIFASIVGHELPWHFPWQRMNPSGHAEVRVLYPAVSFPLQEFSFPSETSHKYWSNLLSCHGRANTHTHLSSQASGISLWIAVWWLGRATGSGEPGKEG